MTTPTNPGKTLCNILLDWISWPERLIKDPGISRLSLSHPHVFQYAYLKTKQKSSLQLKYCWHALTEVQCTKGLETCALTLPIYTFSDILFKLKNYFWFKGTFNCKILGSIWHSSYSAQWNTWFHKTTQNKKFSRQLLNSIQNKWENGSYEERLN